MPYRIESDRPLSARALHQSAFTATYRSLLFAVATALEGCGDPDLDNVRVVDAVTGEIVWRPSDAPIDFTSGL